jgi:hypothetical protein
MRRIRNYVVVAWLSVVALLIATIAPAFFSNQQVADASSHREAPLTSQDPLIDSTDFYMFVSPDRPDTVTIVSNWIPYQGPAAGPNWFRFGDDVLYEIHIDNKGDAQDNLVFQFRFKTLIVNPKTFLHNTGVVGVPSDGQYNLRQYMTVTRVEAPADGSCKDQSLSNCASARRTVMGTDLAVAPGNVGPKSFPLYSAVTAQASIHDVGGMKVFAGPRKETFFADVGSIFDLLTLRPLQGLPGVDSFAGYNVHTISLQIPMNQLTRNGQMPTGASDPNAVIGGWITASRRATTVVEELKAPETSGRWVQVSRLGMPLVNEVVVPLGLKDAFGNLKPWQDRTIPAVVDVVTTNEVAGLLNALYGVKVPPSPRQDIVTVFLTGVPSLNQPAGVVPSEQLRLNMGIPPTATPKRLGVLEGDVAGFPNGRRLTDDVVDIALRVVAGVLVDGFNIAPNNALSDGVDKPHGSLLGVFPYQGTPYDGYFGYTAPR